MRRTNTIVTRLITMIMCLGRHPEQKVTDSTFK